MELIQIFVISLSLWLVLASTFSHVNVIVGRLVNAIRDNDITYTNHFFCLSFYWVLVVISILI